ncbi:MAG TPA: methyltransferase domain-containing protein [Burkholderiaceae bacterium]|nr:methyltransferase domain-containing protein [Burkholderiaceae bacterium]
MISDSPSQAQIDAAKLYETVFVPAVFGPWATIVAEAAEIRPGERVLDVACGTGILARMALERTGPRGAVAGLDVSRAMLAIARDLAPDIAWQRDSAEAMPFPDQSFDAVVSQFGLMFFPDRVRALREMLRVLVPRGRLIVAVWDALACSPGFGTFVDVVERHAGTQVADALRAPFALADRAELAALFHEAGAISVAVSTERCIVRYPSIRTLADDYLRTWRLATGSSPTDEQIDRIADDAERDLQAYVDAAGRLVYETQAHIVTATRVLSR